MVCMSATLQREGFERAFDSVSLLPLLKLHDDSLGKGDGRAIQVRTGAYPRASLLDYDMDWNPVRLSNSGSRFIGLIEKEVESDRRLSTF